MKGAVVVQHGRSGALYTDAEASSRGSGPLRALVVVAFFCGCGGPVPAVEVGRALFSDPRTSSSDFNAVSCSTCHDDGNGEGLERIFAGRSLVDSVNRPSWWGGQAPRLKDAVDNCMTFFMREPAPLTQDDPRGRALYEHLLSISPSSSSDALPLTIVENVTSLARGDPRRGDKVWTNACQPCHGAPHTGAGRLNDLISVVPESSEEFAAQVGFDVDVVVIEKVRHGLFFGVGGNMPPFSVEALSDEDLGALIAFLLP
ncbi:MAG: c-type cytochrome [Deltaproteobacteria bacterium]|nr:c-type cytochrome [Deltaproteobacteria bacterium]